MNLIFLNEYPSKFWWQMITPYAIGPMATDIYGHSSSFIGDYDGIWWVYTWYDMGIESTATMNLEGRFLGWRSECVYQMPKISTYATGLRDVERIFHQSTVCPSRSMVNCTLIFWPFHIPPAHCRSQSRLQLRSDRDAWHSQPDSDISIVVSFFLDTFGGTKILHQSAM